MLLKEAVNNAIKHSDATTIWVKMILENNQLEIIVKDNGHGFSADQVTKGHGLKNYLFRTSLLKGTAKVRSGQFGTEVHFKIPLPG